MADRSQRTEKPTAKRRKEAVRDGQIPRSADVTAWLTVLSFTMLAGPTVGRLRGVFDGIMAQLPALMKDPQPVQAMELFSGAIGDAAMALAPALAVAVVVALVGGVGQGGLHISAKRFKPKFQHLNLGKGLKRMVGGQAAWNLAKTLIKFVVIGALAYQVVRGLVDQAMGSGLWSLSAAVDTTIDASMRLLRVVSMVGLLIAAADYLVERRRIGKSIMMSREEVKREHRQSEGDPHQKGVLRSKQREMSRNRMMASVASADVIIVNPTHVAVALAYEPGSGAPKVVAKGAGAMATRIREEAGRHRLPMVVDIPLARTLYRVCDLGQEIPADLYDAVARVLAFIMALRRRGSVSGVHQLGPSGRDQGGAPAQVGAMPADRGPARTAPQ